MALPLLAGIGRLFAKGVSAAARSAVKSATQSAKSGGGGKIPQMPQMDLTFDTRALGSFHLNVNINSDVFVSASELNRAMDRAEKKMLNATGAHIMTAAKRSLRHRKTVSIPKDIMPILNDWMISKNVGVGLNLGQLDALEKWIQSRLKKVARRIKNSTSKPGDPPRVHFPKTLKYILFAHQPEKHRVIVGPARTPSKANVRVPKVLEKGKRQAANFIDVKRLKTWNRRKAPTFKSNDDRYFWPARVLKIEQRAFMLPAFNEVIPHLKTMSSKTPWIDKAHVRKQKTKKPSRRRNPPNWSWGSVFVGHG